MEYLSADSQAPGHVCDVFMRKKYCKISKIFTGVYGLNTSSRGRDMLGRITYISILFSLLFTMV